MEHWDVWWVSRSTGERRRLTERPLYPGPRVRALPDLVRAAATGSSSSWPSPRPTSGCSSFPAIRSASRLACGSVRQPSVSLRQPSVTPRSAGRPDRRAPLAEARADDSQRRIGDVETTPGSRPLVLVGALGGTARLAGRGSERPAASRSREGGGADAAVRTAQSDRARTGSERCDGVPGAVRRAQEPTVLGSCSMPTTARRVPGEAGGLCEKGASAFTGMTTGRTALCRRQLSQAAAPHAGDRAPARGAARGRARAASAPRAAG